MTNPDGLDTSPNRSKTAAMDSNPAASMLMSQKKKKTTEGRKKIEIKKIDKVSNRHVTFSKRRTGLFNKASEICVLTGAEATILVQSEGKRFYSFAHPTVDGVINRYMSKDGKIDGAAAAATISPEEILEHNAEYDRLLKELEAEKKKMEMQEMATMMNNNNGTNYWWEEEIGHMSLEQLQQYEVALEELRKNVLTKADEKALLRNSYHHGGMMNNVDLNRTAIDAAATICPYDGDFNFNNHASALLPYASMGINNQQVYENNISHHV